MTTYGLVTEGGTYFLMIDDISKYASFVSTSHSGYNVLSQAGQDRQDAFELRYGIYGASQFDAERNFVRYLAEQNTGLTLMRYNGSNFENFVYENGIYRTILCAD